MKQLDIVKWLRAAASTFMEPLFKRRLLEAADEIERLRKK